MDSGPSDFPADELTGLQPDLFPVPNGSTATDASGGAIGGAEGSSGPGLTFGGTTGTPGSGGGGFDIFQAIPGVGAIETLINIVTAIVKDVETAVSQGKEAHPAKIAGRMLRFLENASSVTEWGLKASWDIISDLGVGNLYKAILVGGLEVDTDQFTEEEHKALHTVDTMASFALGLQLVVTAINVAGKSLFANRWAETLEETLAKLPEEMGLSWALGMSLDRNFEAAQGVVLEEAINRQKRPNRVAWPQLRLLLKQHVLTEKQFKELMHNQGFPDDQVEWLMALLDAQIPVGDIAQLYQRGVIDGEKAKELIGDLGFSEQQTGWLFDLYIAKADTEAASIYRSTARQLFAANLISEEQYRHILITSNYPKLLIDDDIAAITLEHNVGRVLQSVTVIKSLYQHGKITAQEAQGKLQELNYAPTYINDLIATWDTAPLHKTHGLSQSKVLSYYMSGLLSEQQARENLSRLNVDSDTIDFLIAHPSSSNGTRVHQLTTGLVTQAYIDGAIPPSELDAAFTKAGAGKDTLPYLTAVAQYRLAHKKGSAGAHVPLSKGEWDAAYKAGLIDFPTLVHNLEQIGYAPDDALLLAEIANKGPLQKPQAPIFSNVQAAIEYMLSVGYVVVNPPDPKLLAAEGVLSQYGYSWIPPAVTPPAPGTGGTPGGNPLPPVGQLP